MAIYNENDQRRFLVELQGFERQGISIWLENIPSSSESVTRAMCVREDSDYMRDYVYDQGELKEIRFDKVRELKAGRRQQKSHRRYR